MFALQLVLLIVADGPEQASVDEAEATQVVTP
jgi:hypothetical protein